jgi:hypothetical protein
MLSNLDSIIFPDRCEVIEITASQRYVYPIFKNGKSSLYHYGKNNKCRILINEQIKKLNCIDIILREPEQRFRSGINTFIQMTMRDNPNLNVETVTWFAQNYLFLNRHYAPQFLWLVNLARYTNSDASLNFLDIDQLNDIIDINEKPHEITPITEELDNQLANTPNNEMYNRIDRVLMDCVGQSLTFAQLISYIQKQDSVAYDYVIGRSQRILGPTYVLSKT